jgi:DNA-binding response OmpR family regulator
MAEIESWNLLHVHWLTPHRLCCRRKLDAGMHGVPKALVVEDEPMIAMELQDVLMDLGFEVYVAHNLPTGTAFFQSRCPDLGIFDVHIGGDLIFPLAAELRARSLTIIFLTGDANRLPPEWMTYQIVPKPLSVPGLYAALRAVGFEAMVPEHVLGGIGYSGR